MEASKILAFNAINDTYTGSTLMNDWKIKIFLDSSNECEKVNIIEVIVLSVNKALLNEEDLLTCVVGLCDDNTKPTDNWHISYVINPSLENQVFLQGSTECWYNCDSGYSWDWVLESCEVNSCDTNYTWNWSNTCVADSRNENCTWLLANSVWNIASSITQTWNWSDWLPNISWEYNITSSSTECRYKCDTDTSWDWNSCVYSCAATPTYPLIQTLVWTPTEANQTWVYDRDFWNCVFSCIEDYKWVDEVCEECWLILETHPDCSFFNMFNY